MNRIQVVGILPPPLSTGALLIKDINNLIRYKSHYNENSDKGNEG
jgi:hypothetical protein